MKNEKNAKRGQMSKAITKITSDLNRFRGTAFYSGLTTSAQSAMESVCVAVTISHNILDITVDDKGGMFYDSSLTSFADSVISEVNEKVIIDVDMVSKLVYPMWATRHSLAIGNIRPWEYCTGFSNFLPAGYSQLVSDFITGMEDS